MSLFPIFVKMAGRPTLVVGGGALAVTKIEPLLEAGAQVTVVAPWVAKKIVEWEGRGEIKWVSREFEASDARGKSIVFAATEKRDVDRHVSQICRAHGVWCNAIDDPEYCDFYSPAIVRRGDLQIAVSTNGQSPALAQQIRKQLETQFDDGWCERIADLGHQRRVVMAAMATGPERTAILHAQARAAMQSENDGVVRRLGAAVWRWLNTEDDTVALI